MWIEQSLLFVAAIIAICLLGALKVALTASAEEDRMILFKLFHHKREKEDT